MTILLGLWWGIDGGKKASGVVICGPPQTLCGVYGENDTTVCMGVSYPHRNTWDWMHCPDAECHILSWCWWSFLTQLIKKSELGYVKSPSHWGRGHNWFPFNAEENACMKCWIFKFHKAILKLYINTEDICEWAHDCGKLWWTALTDNSQPVSIS